MGNKLDETCRRIRADIERNRLWGRRLAGYRAMADDLGVCRQTVQRALDVLEAEGVLERLHGSGTFALTPSEQDLRSRVRSLAVIVNAHALSRLSRVAIAAILDGLAFRARSAGIAVRTLEWDDPESRAELADTRAMRRVDGFVFVRFMRHDVVDELMRLRRRPVVVVDQDCQNMPVTVVNDETFPGARSLVRHLLGLGHRRVAFLDIDDRARWNSCKFAGYAAALKDFGVAEDPRLIVAPRASVSAAQEDLDREVDHAVERLLGLPDPPTALFAYDDRRALAAMASLRRRGVEPGRDMAVAGFGDTAVRGGFCDDLTSCRIPFRKMGELAVRAALQPPFAAGRQGTVFVQDRTVARASTMGPGALGRVRKQFNRQQNGKTKKQGVLHEEERVLLGSSV